MRAAVCFALLLHASVAVASRTCAGDCDRGGSVSADELVLTVGVLLGRAAIEACRPADTSGDGLVSVDELVLAVNRARSGCEPNWRFTDVTAEAGIDYVHGYVDPGGKPIPLLELEEIVAVAGGVAAGDYDRDGWVDLYAVGGDATRNYLLHNRGGVFEEVAVQAGVALPRTRGSGPTFADFDGDGWLDLFVGAVDDSAPVLFRNRRDGTFADVTARSGITFTTGLYSTLGAAFGDYDRDGDLDLFIAHWGTALLPERRIEHLWRNDGSGRFSPATAESGLSIRTGTLSGLTLYWTFTPNFTDINGDGWPDLLSTSDFRTTQVFLNTGRGGFRDATTAVITDENGMGVAIGDYDNDLDLDWFVSSILGELSDGPRTGNRLYRNRGDGTFDDATDLAGVRDGNWGWAACSADFDNDGWLDLFHVNGWSVAASLVDQFAGIPSRLFMARGGGTFVEEAGRRGLVDRDEGRGVVCFDYDRDGDIDIFTANAGEPPRLYRNDGGNQMKYLAVTLRGVLPNSEAIGARILVTAGERTQMRELRAGSNYLSQDPAEAHFGLGDTSFVTGIEVIWPDQSVTRCPGVAANRSIEITWSETGACDLRTLARP